MRLPEGGAGALYEDHQGREHQTGITAKTNAHVQEHARRRSGDRRLSRARKGALRLWPVRPRQYRLPRRALRTLRRHQDGLRPPRERRRLHGGRVLPRRRQADGDIHLLRSGFGQSADCARQLLSRFRSVPGGDRQRADQPIQPRRLSGTLSALSGGLSVHRASLLQTRIPAHARRHGSARNPSSMEDHGDGAAGAGRARCSLRHLQGGRRRGNPQAGRVERQHLLPLRRRSGRRDEGRRYAARGQTAGHPGRPGRQIRRRGGGLVAGGGTLAHSGRVVGERHRRHRFPPSPGARAHRPQRSLSGQPRRAHRRRAACARRAPFSTKC